MITVYGADHPGIVRSVSAVLAGHGANITDLQTRLTGEGDSALYVMFLEVELRADSVDRLQRELSETAETASVDLTIAALDAEAL